MHSRICKPRRRGALRHSPLKLALLVGAIGIVVSIFGTNGILLSAQGIPDKIRPNPEDAARTSPDANGPSGSTQARQPRAAAATAPAAPQASPKIAIGDVLSIDISTNLESLPQQSARLLLRPTMIALVDPSGAVSLGAMYGEVKVLDRSVHEAEVAVASAIDARIKKAHAEAATNGVDEKRGDPDDFQINVRIVRLGHRTENATGDLQSLLMPAGRASIGPRLLQPGDILQVEATIEGLAMRRSVIEPDGNLALGARWGRVNVAGQVLGEAEDAVRRHLATSIKDPEVQITYAGHSSDGSMPPPGDGNDVAARVMQFQRDIADLKGMLREFKSWKPR